MHGELEELSLEKNVMVTEEGRTGKLDLIWMERGTEDYKEWCLVLIFPLSYFLLPETKDLPLY